VNFFCRSAALCSFQKDLKYGKKANGKKQSAKIAENNAAKQSSPQPEIPPIVAIGASAGGLEALHKFFENMPEDSGIGFVVVTHARPQRESMLPELLSNSTRMPVVSSTEGMAIKQNQVIVAKDSFLTVKNGVLSRTKEISEVSYHSIDYFFRALAADQQQHATSVVLSGSGNDGTLGIKAIKAAGGMVMVQDPGSAKYTGMPESALATGLADYVRQPEELPEALQDYGRRIRGAAAALLLARRQRLPHSQKHPGQGRFCRPECRHRSAVYPPGPDRLPQSAHIPEPRRPKTAHDSVSLRAQQPGHAVSGNGGSNHQVGGVFQVD
jgi:chemotaxis response regulator CheB